MSCLESNSGLSYNCSSVHISVTAVLWFIQLGVSQSIHWLVPATMLSEDVALKQGSGMLYSQQASLEL